MKKMGIIKKIRYMNTIYLILIEKCYLESKWGNHIILYKQSV